MAFEQRLQSDGAIYTNSFKQSEKQPDWTGKVSMTREVLKELVTKIKEENSTSVELRIALWNRTSKKGNEYKYARLDVAQEQKKPEPEPEPEPKDDFVDDDIPF
jgi:single-stranded DNA-binding protein